MSFASKNDTIAGRIPAPASSDSTVTAARFTQTLVTADSAANNVGVIGILPAGQVPSLPMLVSTSGLGGSAAISIGLLNAAGTDLSTDAADGGAVWAAAVAVGSAATADVAPTAALLAVKPAAVDRKIAVKFTTAGSAAGTLTLVVPYSAAA